MADDIYDDINPQDFSNCPDKLYVNCGTKSRVVKFDIVQEEDKPKPKRSSFCLRFSLVVILLLLGGLVCATAATTVWTAIKLVEHDDLIAEQNRILLNLESLFYNSSNMIPYN